MKTITVSNVLVNRVVGYAGNQDNNNYSDVRLRIRVQTVDANGNATLYSSLDKTYVQNSTNSLILFTESIKVPKTGTIVIQVDQMGLECALAQTSCVGKPSKQEFFEQRTYTDVSASPTFPFPMFQSDLSADICCP